MAAGTMIAIDFNSDETQSVACKWREDNVYQQLLVVQGSVLAGPVALLSDEHANKGELTAALSGGSTAYLTGVAHGACNSFPADATQTVLSTTTYNPPQVAGKIIHLVSCYAGAMLGSKLAKSGGGGAAAFFGYTDKFQWPEGVADEIVDIFFSCDAQIDFALAGGKTAGEAYSLAVQAYQDAHETLLSKYPDIGTQIVAMLDANLACLCGPQVGYGPYGCADARLGQPCPSPGE
jgi:hypothetical protein